MKGHTTNAVVLLEKGSFRLVQRRRDNILDNPSFTLEKRGHVDEMGHQSWHRPIQSDQEALEWLLYELGDRLREAEPINCVPG